MKKGNDLCCCFFDNPLDKKSLVVKLLCYTVKHLLISLLHSPSHDCKVQYKSD